MYTIDSVHMEGSESTSRERKKAGGKRPYDQLYDDEGSCSGSIEPGTTTIERDS
jgi:hypothetical protein